MFKNESGFSLVELAVAAGLAVALGTLAVTALAGTSSKLSGQATSGDASAEAAASNAIDTTVN